MSAPCDAIRSNHRSNCAYAAKDDVMHQISGRHGGRDKVIDIRRAQLSIAVEASISIEFSRARTDRFERLPRSGEQEVLRVVHITQDRVVALAVIDEQFAMRMSDVKLMVRSWA